MPGAAAARRCRRSMYTSCLNYGDVAKGHQRQRLTTDGGFAEYAVNHVNTLVHVPDDMTDEEATLVVTAEHLDVRARRSRRPDCREGVVVTGPGPIGLLRVSRSPRRSAPTR